MAGSVTSLQGGGRALSAGGLLESTGGGGAAAIEITAGAATAVVVAGVFEGLRHLKYQTATPTITATMTSTTTAQRYRWSDLEQDHPMPTVDRRRIIGEQAMISEIRLHAGCHVPTHAHENVAALIEAPVAVVPADSAQPAPFTHGADAHSSMSMLHVPPVTTVHVVAYCSASASNVSQPSAHRPSAYPSAHAHE